MERIEELAKTTLIITIGRVSTQFISFLLLPLYTTLLNTEEYGIVDFITSLVPLFIPVISLMVDQGVFRYLLSYQTEEEKKRIISSSFFILVFSCIVSIAAYCIISLFVSISYKIWLLLIVFATMFSNLFLQIARGLKRTSDYALGSFICSFSTILLNVLYIAFMHLGAKGMLLATFLGNLICCIFLFFKLQIGEFISFSSFEKQTAKNELRYSIPLVPNQLSLWVMNSSDRLIVVYFLGAAANGILGVSHKFPAIYMTFYNIFQLAWHETGTLHFFDEDRDVFFSDTIKQVFSFFSTLCMGVIVLLPLVFSLLARGEFGNAYNNIPIYLVASLFNVVVGFLGVVYVATKKTSEIAKTTIISALINILINVSLINSIGLYAASISTLIGNFVTMIYRITDARKYIRIKYDFRLISLVSASIIFCCLIYYLNNKVISLVFFPFFIVFAYLMNRETINSILGIIENKTGISKKKIYSFFISVFLVFIFAGTCILYNKKVAQPKDIRSVYKNDIITVKSENMIFFSDFKADDFTCTGLTYDSVDDSFWIGDYGTKNVGDEPIPRVVEIEKGLKRIKREISIPEITGLSPNLQGIAYDSKDDGLWLAVGDYLLEMDKNGTLLTTVYLNDYTDNKSNGICYNEKDDTLWVLCASKYLLNYKKDGTLINEISFNYMNQDHLCIYQDYLFASIGADYTGKDNYVCKIDLSDGNIKALYQVEEANSLEGICFLDGKMFIINDGYYHNDLIGHSYITVYNAKEVE